MPDTIDAEIVTVTDEEADAAWDRSTALTDAERYLAMDPEDFGALAAKQRDIVLFVLLKDVLGEIRVVNDEIQTAKDKVKELASPEGIAALIEEFTGGGGPMALMKGLL
jgi:hypothetical protein